MSVLALQELRQDEVHVSGEVETRWTVYLSRYSCSPLSFAFSPIVNTSRQHQPAVSICPNSHLENGSQPSALICSKSAMRRGKGNERVCMHACVCVCAHVLRQMM